MRPLFASLIISLIVLSGNSFARPVSYPGGWTFMQMNDSSMHSFHAHYSPTAYYSIGYKTEYWRETDWQFHGIQVNNLLKRWNMPEAQANFYIKSGGGFAYSDFKEFDGKTEPSAFTGISIDAENRRFFAMYENRLTYAGKINKSYQHKARLGVAPYIGDYGDLHTWLMLQVDHQPESFDNFTVTPLIRFFYETTLLEAGVSNHGDLLFNLVKRF